MLRLEPIKFNIIIPLQVMLLSTILFLKLGVLLARLLKALFKCTFLILLLLIDYTHRFNLGLASIQILIVVLHQLAFFAHECINLLSSVLKFSLNGHLFLRKRLLVIDELLGLPAVVSYLTFCDFAPFLKELNVVLLSLLLDHLVVGVHFAHQFYMPFMHMLHIVFDARNVRLRKLNWHQVLHAILSL